MRFNPKEKADEVIQRFDDLKADRQIWETTLQEIVDLVRPNAKDFNRTRTKGRERTELIFDATATYANEQFAGGLNGALTNSSETWCNITLAEKGFEASDEENGYLQAVRDKIFYEYSKSAANFNSTLHEYYLDLGAFGTGVIYQDWNPRGRHLIFRTFPLADCMIDESEMGLIDTLYRKVEYTTRQCRQKWGDDVPQKIKESKKPDHLWTFIHGVYPRSDEKMRGGFGNQGFPFASCWVCKDTGTIVSEGGYKQFPYHVSRWMKISGETLGRSPAWNSLPDIRMLQEVKKTLIKQSQLAIAPPLIVDDDGVMLPIKVFPNSLIFKTPGTDPIKPLEVGSNLAVGNDTVDRLQESIMRQYYADWMRRFKKNERQTATEVMDDRDEMIRLMSPMLGRQQSELLSPMLIRSYELLSDNEAMPPFPQSMANRRINIEYTSPASRAQYASKAQNIQRFITDITPFAQVNPDVMNAFKVEELTGLLAKLRDVPVLVLRSQEEIEEKKQQQQQAQQMQQMAQMGGDVAGAVKDLSVAGKNAPGLIGL